MIAYNKKGLENLRLQQSAKTWRRHQFIDDAELKAIVKNNPTGFFNPNIFLRAGLFLLGLIVILFSMGLLGLMLASARVLDSFMCPFVFAALIILVMELFIRERNHFRSGIDDAARWVALGLLTGSFFMLLNKIDTEYYAHNHGLSLSLFIFIVSAGFVIRYADMAITLISSTAFFSSVLFLCHDAGRYGDMLAPFVVMIFAASAYFVNHKQGVKLGACYADCTVVIEVVCTLVFYAAGNYLAIDELNKALNPAATTIAFASFFWVWTFTVPVLYVYFGIIKKDRLMLRVGLLLIAAAVYTFRTYFHVMSIEAALVLAGSILFIVSYSLIKYLGKPRNGFVYKEIDLLGTEVLNVETIAAAAIANPATQTHQPTQPTQERFGGGDFGGGGSGGAYQ